MGARSRRCWLGAAGRGLHEVVSGTYPDAGGRGYSPVHGHGSPVAPPLVATDTPDGRATGGVTVGKPHEGPPGLVHGGVVAWWRGGVVAWWPTLFDHMLTRAVRAAGRGGLTATLTVRYRRPVHLGVPLVLTAETGETGGHRTTATARLAAGETRTPCSPEVESLLVALCPERLFGAFDSMDRPVGAWTTQDPDQCR